MDPSTRYILLRPNEDGNPVWWLDQHDLEELLGDAEGYTFLALDHPEPDTNYWPEGSAMLLKIEVVVPVPVTSKWRLP